MISTESTFIPTQLGAEVIGFKKTCIVTLQSNAITKDKSTHLAYPPYVKKLHNIERLDGFAQN